MNALQIATPDASTDYDVSFHMTVPAECQDALEDAVRSVCDRFGARLLEIFKLGATFALRVQSERCHILQQVIAALRPYGDVDALEFHHNQHDEIPADREVA